MSTEAELRAALKNAERAALLDRQERWRAAINAPGTDGLAARYRRGAGLPEGRLAEMEMRERQVLELRQQLAKLGPKSHRRKAA